MKKIQDVLDEVDLDVNELPEPTQRRVQTYANLEKQLIAAKLELEALDEPDPEKHQVYEDAITYFNDYEADVIQSIQAYANRLEHELQAKAMKERRDRELQAKENENRIKARKEAEEKDRMQRKQMEEQRKAQDVVVPSSPKKGPEGPSGNKKQRAVTKLQNDRKTLGGPSIAN